MNNPAMVLPEAMTALQNLAKACSTAGVPEETIHLVHLRASQINGCSVCVDMHAKAALKGGDSIDRVIAVAAWRETPYFDDAERAALALTESLTRLADRADPVPDDVWEAVADSYAEEALAALILEIAHVNLWNRLNAATHQQVGAW
jgi:AhpD family alkylhydroperoxidase